MRRVLVLLFLAILAAGCAGGSGGGSPSAAAPGGLDPSAGNLLVRHDFSRLKATDTAAHYDYFGLDQDGRVVYGRVRHLPAPEQLLAGVPLGVKRLQVEYRDANQKLLARSEIEVALVPGALVPVPVFAQLPVIEVELVNDSDTEDSQVYVILSGSTVVLPAGSTLPFHQYGAGTGKVTAVGLPSIDPQPGSWVSPYSGKTRKVYRFAVNELDGGRLWVSFGTPVSYTGDADPTAEAPFRLDKMEFAFNAGGAGGGGADLTSLDYYGIPMELQSIRHGQVQGTRTFYVSSKSLLKQIYGLRSGNAMASAFLGQGTTSPTPDWNPNTDSMSTFARVLGPQTIAGQPGTLTASPFTSFFTYMNSLVNAPALNLSGSGGVGHNTPNTSYQYTSFVTPDGAGGYLVFLYPTAPMPTAPFGLEPVTNVPKQLPANLPIYLSLPIDQLDFNLYSAAATSWAVPVPVDLQNASKNSIYATIVGDFVSAVQFGYLDNAAQNNSSSAWYANFPVFLPFSLARPAPDDGRYNPYAALFYNLSDSYGFPFSDRNGRISPLLDIGDAHAMRVVVMNDNRLDAPAGLTVTDVGLAHVTATWSPSTDGEGSPATGYTLSCSDGFNPPLTATAVGTTATVTGLSQGTAYSVRVIATAAERSSAPSIPVTALTLGSTPLSPTIVSAPVVFGFQLKWPGDSSPTGLTLSVASQENNPPTPSAATGSAQGLNQFLLTIFGTDPNTGVPTLLHMANLFVQLQPAAGGFQFLKAVSSDGSNPDSHQPSSTVYTSGLHSTNPLIVSEVFQPEPRKLASPVTAGPTGLPTPPFASALPLPTPSVQPSPPGNLIGAPTLTGFSPPFGTAGTALTVTGTNFIPGSVLKIGGQTVPSVKVSADGTSLSVVLATATTGFVTVTTPLGTASSAPQVFTFDSTPEAKKATPAQGPPGTVVVIRGLGFLTASSVHFNGIPAASFTVVDDRTIHAVVPQNSNATGTFSVSNPDGTGTSTQIFTVTGAPFTFMPPAGPTGTPVTLMALPGTFTGATQVQFDGVQAPANVTLGGAMLSTTVPAAARSGAIKVIYPNFQDVSATNFQVQPPTFTFAPAKGPVGTLLTLTATVGDFTNATSVQVGASNPIPVSPAPGATTLQVNVPLSLQAGSADVRVILSAGPPEVATARFDVEATGFTITPTSGGYFDTVTITATEGSLVDASQVIFGGAGQPVSPVNGNPTTFAVEVAQSALSGVVGILLPSGTVSGPTFTVTHPRVTGFSPTQGTRGTAVVVTGTGFLGATGDGQPGTVTSASDGLLTFGGVPAASYTVLSDTRLTTTVPNAPPGPATVLLIDRSTGTGSPTPFMVKP